MSPILPDPDPIALPAQVALLKVLLVALLPLHLLAMNLALGGGFVAAWATWRARRGAELERQRHETLRGVVGSALVVATAATITLGIAPLLFLQVLYGQLFYTSSVLMAWWWMTVIVLLLAGYYSYYAFVFKQRLRGSSAPFALTGAVLLTLVGFLFTNNMTLMLRPPAHWGALYAASAAGLHLNVSDPTHGPRFLHFLVASFAVTGLFLALRARGATDETQRWTAVVGARLFAGATHVQLLVGLGFLFTLPADVRALLLGGRMLDTLVLWAAIAVAIAATLVVRRAPVAAALLVGATVFSMSFVRHRVREALIAPFFSAETLAVQPQVGLLILFALLLVAGLVTLAWMIGKLVTAPARG